MPIPDPLPEILIVVQISPHRRFVLRSSSLKLMSLFHCCVLHLVWQFPCTTLKFSEIKLGHARGEQLNQLINEEIEAYDGKHLA